MRHASLISIRSTLFGLLAAILMPFAAAAQTNVIDLTDAFIKSGAVIDQLKVSQISDVVLIIGRTNDVAKAQAASRIATTLGYTRVANLIVVRDDIADDAAIVYTSQRRLELEPSLTGCRFRVASILGVIQLTGAVIKDEQEALAVHILSKIDGVKEIHPNLARL
jgi:osmotically-inducible protein OsmY